MKLITAILGRTLLVGMVAMLCPWLATPGWALGPAAPPNVFFAAVWVDNFTSNAFPVCYACANQLVANVGVLIPGGSVPLNVVEVLAPPTVRFFPANDKVAPATPASEALVMLLAVAPVISSTAPLPAILSALEAKAPAPLNRTVPSEIMVAPV